MLSSQRKELEDSFLNQKANEHDQKVRENVRKELEEKLLEKLPRGHLMCRDRGFKCDRSEAIQECKEIILSVFKEK